MGLKERPLHRLGKQKTLINPLYPANQKGALGIMTLLVFDNGALAIGGVTVGAAMEAGIVGADIDAFDAATGLALAGIFFAVDPAVEHPVCWANICRLVLNEVKPNVYRES